MKFRLLLTTTALVAGALAASAGASPEVTVLGWGGAYTKSQVEAYHKPFTAATGVKVISVDADNPATPIKAHGRGQQRHHRRGERGICRRACASATRACWRRSMPRSWPPRRTAPRRPRTSCPAPSPTAWSAPTSYSTIFAYDKTKFADKAPTTIADFFDTTDFPGKRGMRKGAKVNLEMALMADGVPADEVYATLETPEGVDRAFAKLDTIKNDVVWWEAGAQPPQLLADGEVAMTTAYNGRIFGAAVDEGKPFEIVWDGQVYELEGYVIPKGAPNLDEAIDVHQVRHRAPSRWPTGREWISYGPPRKSSGAAGRHVPGRQDRDGAEPADLRGQPQERAAVVLRVLGRPRHRAERALQRLARRELIRTRCPGGAAPGPR